MHGICHTALSSHPQRQQSTKGCDRSIKILYGDARDSNIVIIIISIFFFLFCYVWQWPEVQSDTYTYNKPILISFFLCRVLGGILTRTEEWISCKFGVSTEKPMKRSSWFTRTRTHTKQSTIFEGGWQCTAVVVTPYKVFKHSDFRKLSNYCEAAAKNNHNWHRINERMFDSPVMFINFCGFVHFQFIPKNYSILK